MTTELQAAVELDKAFETVADYAQEYPLLGEAHDTIRAHIAAQSSEIEALKDWWYKNKVPQGWSFAVYDTSKYKLIAKTALAQGAKK